ncbi:MAG: hypothetical protein AAF902_24100 [Chloroflexota bacterium]
MKLTCVWTDLNAIVPCSISLLAISQRPSNLQLLLDTPVIVQTLSDFLIIDRLHLAQNRYTEADELPDHIEASLPI